MAKRRVKRNACAKWLTNGRWTGRCFKSYDNAVKKCQAMRRKHGTRCETFRTAVPRVFEKQWK
jgi:hypothetical protein